MQKLTLLCTCALAGSLSAQVTEDPITVSTFPAPEIITHAGTYFAATGQLVSAGTSEGAGGPIYNNTASLGFIFDQSDGAIVIDEGILPGSSNPIIPGLQSTYLVRSFDIGYVTGAADTSIDGPGAHIEVCLYENYFPCTDLDDAPTPSACYDLTGLPGSTDGGPAGFVVTIDLTGMELCLQADATGTFDGLTDFFGYSLRLIDDVSPAGFLISGDPSFCAPGDGLAFTNPPGCDGAGTGTGFGNLDSFFLEGLGCVFFGGYPENPYGGFYMRIESDIAGECLSNDDCERASVIRGSGQFPWTNEEATTDGAGDPLCDSFGTDQIENDVWFAWEADATGTFAISTVGLTTLDTRIAAFDGTDCESSSVVACNDDDPDAGGLQSTVTIDAVCNESYLIRLGSFSPTATGSGEFRIELLGVARATAENYCRAGATGSLMGFDGSLLVSDDDFALTAADVPDTFGLFIFSSDQNFVPFGAGALCIGGVVFRLDPRMMPPGSNEARRELDFGNPGAPESLILPGTCWNFQYLFRIPPQGAGMFDLTDGLSVQFGL